MFKISTSDFRTVSMHRRFQEFLAMVTDGVVHGVYVTGNLCNQALHVMTEHFSHFAKCLNSLAISRNA